jgi:hypothetical protein
MNHSFVKYRTVMADNITTTTACISLLSNLLNESLICQSLNNNGRQYNIMNHSSVKPKTVIVNNITTTT